MCTEQTRQRTDCCFGLSNGSDCVLTTSVLYICNIICTLRYTCTYMHVVCACVYTCVICKKEHLQKHELNSCNSCCKISFLEILAWTLKITCKITCKRENKRFPCIILHHLAWLFYLGYMMHIHVYTH